MKQKHVLFATVDLDSDESKLKEDQVKNLKNLQINVNDNKGGDVNKGDNVGVATPYPGNYLMDGQTGFPSGENLCIGTYLSKETNELYCFVYNSSSNHFIYRIKGDTGAIQIVYQGSCLNFQKDPKHFISDGRCYIRRQQYVDHNGDDAYRVYLIFTDNYNDQRFISVEDSIATNSFNKVQFSYFNVNGYSCDDCYLINLAVPHSMKCIGIDPIDRTEDAEKKKQNQTVNAGWRFRLRYIDVFGRVSAHGIISDLFMSVLGGNCVSNNNSLARCFKLTIDAGCPLVDKIQVEFSKNSSDWFLYDTLEKYKREDGVAWYSRDISNPYQDKYDELIDGGATAQEAADGAKYYTKYNSGNNTFDYTFCGDKECQPISVEETDLNYLAVPRKSSSLMSIDKGICLANNLHLFEPFPRNTLDKVDIAVTPPGQTCESDNVLRTIEIYVPIWMYQYGAMTGLAYFAGSEYGKNGHPEFGAGEVVTATNIIYPFNWAQYMPKTQEGFIGYLAGTKYTAISEQIRLDLATGAETPVPLPIIFLGLGTGANFYPFNAGDTLLCQKFTFKVPPGQYSFRIAASYAEPLGNYQRTSTNIYGTIQLGTPHIKRSDERELIINCCDGDVKLNGTTDTTLVICDMSRCKAITGYIRESSTTNNPIEYVDVAVANSGVSSFACAYTDYNGYFFAFTDDFMLLALAIIQLCGGNVQIAKTSPSFRHNHYQNIYPSTGAFDNADRRKITGKVVLCDTDIGVSGALVVCKNGPAVYTDANGEFEILMHNKSGSVPSTDYVFLSQSGGCRYGKCDDNCYYCFTTYNVAYVGCGPSRDTEIDGWEVAKAAVNKGLESGGRYGVAIIGHDWANRHGAAQVLDKYYIDIPPLTETQVFDFSTVSWTMANDIVFPSWVKYITFAITKNLNNKNRIMWVIDKVEFIDNGGNVVGANGAPTKVRIYYESLIEYNKQSTFATNTIWQFLEENNEYSMQGDIVEFIKNGDGTWFAGGIQAQVVYDKDGKYFDVVYNNDLASLVEGALVKLIRPKDCEDNHIFYELCSTVRVTNGIPEAFAGDLNAFDSYMQNRQIPIPETTKDAQGNIIKTVNTKWFTYLFEHHSPSDIWGDHIGNFGRVFFKNPFEREVRNVSEFALSGALIDKSNFNGLNYFLTENATSFAEQEWGAVMLAFSELNTVIAICEHNNFVVGYNDNLIRVGVDGIVSASSVADKFGKPQRSIGSDYGCQEKDINSIKRYAGTVFFVDRDNNALVMHNYQEGPDMSQLGYKGYLTRKIEALNLNDNDQEKTHDYYFTAGINSFNKEYILSITQLKIGAPEANRLNTTLGVGEELKETMVIDAYRGVLKNFVSFVPESFGLLPGYKNGVALVTFKDGKAYVHHTADVQSDNYNNFYGVQCKKVVEVISNVEPEVAKTFLYLDVYVSPHKLIAERVLTEGGQQSRIKGAYWQKHNKFYSAAFLRSMNTPFNPDVDVSKRILEGDILFGRWCKIRLVSEDADDGKYCELSSVTTVVKTNEKS